jgi:hypothetical protein
MMIGYDICDCFTMEHFQLRLRMTLTTKIYCSRLYILRYDVLLMNLKKKTMPMTVEVRPKYLNDIIPLTLSSFSTARLIFFSNLLKKHRNIIKLFIYFLEFLLHKRQRVRHY